MLVIEICWMEVFGGYVVVCVKCGYQYIVYNFCKNWYCLKCQGFVVLDWMVVCVEDLLLVEYFYVVFMLLVQIGWIVYWNKKLVYGFLFCVLVEILVIIVVDFWYLGVCIGMISVLYIWGLVFIYYLYVYIIVFGGGLLLDGV